MTIALCTVCGSTKCGAVLPCEECGASGPLPPDLATYFTDHYWSEETLESLGRVVRHINAQHRSPTIRAYAFLAFVADAQPDAFQFRPNALTRIRVRRFLRTASLPSVEWTESDLFVNRKSRREAP